MYFVNGNRSIILSPNKYYFGCRFGGTLFVNLSILSGTRTMKFNDGLTIIKKFVFLYEESEIVGVIFTNSSGTGTYYYDKNPRGDVIGILDNSGNTVVKYKYDAYGNCTRYYYTNSDLADSNPIRYRSYYYDEDTGLYYFRDLISSPRFSLIILMMEAEQYKKNIAKGSRGRTKYRKYELIPISLRQAYVFKSKNDYQLFIPKDLSERFTVKEYSRASKIHGINAYSIVKTLCHIGLLAADGKIGRAIAYKKSKKEEN